MRLAWILVSILIALFAVRADAQSLGERHVAVELVAESDGIAPGGTTTVAIVSRPQPGWHGYWQNPGAVGTDPTIEWTLPDGFVAGPLRYPVPERLLIAGIMNYVYERPWTQFVTVTAPTEAVRGSVVPVRLDIDYLVCTREVCVPERASLTTQLTVGDSSPAADRRAAFDTWRRAMPRPLGSPATFAVADGRFRMAVPFPSTTPVDDAYFYPLTDGAIDYAAPQVLTRQGDHLLIETAATGSVAKVEGVLALANGQGFTLTAGPGAVPTAEPSGGGATWAIAVAAFLGAVLGGLILNVMPCVFPILSLKALGLARAGHSEMEAKVEAAFYAAGVILTCVALGAAMLGLRAGGSMVGWAFQLTDPRSILFLLLLVTGIAFNLAGLFELPVPRFAQRSGAGGAFATGALAAFVATPCAGPFMGAALGSALVLPWAAALAVFAGLGLGIALPFLALGFVPMLRRKLPKPGPWMDRFRKALSVPMFTTALALAWVLGRLAGVDGMALGLAISMLAMLGLWWVGRRQAGGRNRPWLPLAAVLPLTSAGFLFLQRAPVAAAANPVGAQPFSESRLAALRTEGKPVFAYFTADWCLTCKVNEKTTIETAAVRDALRDGDVAVLVGDWTDGDPALGRFIEANGRAGVPLYLWYAPGAAEPQVLPQVLTPAMLTRLARGERG